MSLLAISVVYPLHECKFGCNKLEIFSFSYKTIGRIVVWFDLEYFSL